MGEDVLTEAEQLKVREIARIVMQEMKPEFVCVNHCTERQGYVRTWLIVLSIFVIIALGERGIEIWKMIRSAGL